MTHITHPRPMIKSNVLSLVRHGRSLALPPTFSRCGYASFEARSIPPSHSSQAVERTYENAMAVITSRKRIARPHVTSTVTASSHAQRVLHDASKLKGTPSIVGMSEWLRMIGHTDEDINALNVIHIAGTKGKGSTCTFTECILRSHGVRTGYPKKTGLYTSPHLMRPEERIRINSEELSPAKLAKYFFEVYDCLPQLATSYDPDKAPIDRGPRQLQLWALLAFHVFIREKVDVTILETHNGGEYDATNVVNKPIVTAITTLGMDHIEMLGPYIENIAWHKSGIYKPGAVSLSIVQDSAPAKVLQERAATQGERIRFVSIDDARLPKDSLKLRPLVQQKNASLATAAVEAWLEKKLGSDSAERIVMTEDVVAGVEQFSLPGRFQVVHDGDRTWFLDSAHNDMSAVIAVQWFTETGHQMRQDTDPVRILIFSHINELRDSVLLLENLATALCDLETGVSHVIFSTYTESQEQTSQEKVNDPGLFHATWSKILPETKIWDEPTVQGAMDRAEALGREHARMQTLITGSQHLVGPALRVLQARGIKFG